MIWPPSIRIDPIYTPRALTDSVPRTGVFGLVDDVISSGDVSQVDMLAMRLPRARPGAVGLWQHLTRARPRLDRGRAIIDRAGGLSRAESSDRVGASLRTNPPLCLATGSFFVRLVHTSN